MGARTGFTCGLRGTTFKRVEGLHGVADCELRWWAYCSNLTNMFILFKDYKLISSVC